MAGEKNGTRARLLSALRLLGRTWQPVFIWLCLAGALTALVATPFVAWVMGKGLAVTGAGAVLNYAITDLVLSIPGLLLGILWALLISSVVVIVVGGPVLLTAAARADRLLPARAVTGRVIRATGRVPGIGGLKLALLATLALPLVTSSTAALAAIALIPFGASPLAELLSEDLQGITLLGLGVAVLAALALLLYVRWCFAFHVLLVDRVSLGEAMKRSVALGRGSRGTTAKAIVAHHVTQALLLGVTTLALGVLERLALGLVDAEGASYPLLVATLVAFHAVILGLVALVGIGREAALLTNRYYELKPDAATAVRRALDRETEAPETPGLFQGRPRRLAVVVLVGFAVATLFTMPRVFEELDRAGDPIGITAHRGSSAEAPENTMAAFRLAIEDGATWAELDVLQAKDGTLAILHDVNLGRLAGLDRPIYELTKEDLTELEVGSHFDERFRGEPIPTLEQVIREVKGKLRLNIELKTHGHETDFPAAVVALLRELEFQDECVITSLDQAALAGVRAADPAIRIGMIITVVVGDPSALDTDFYSVQPLIATTDFIRRAHRRGREVHVWTINDREGMTRFANRGADNLITDYPRLAREVLDARTAGDEIGAALARLFRR